MISRTWNVMDLKNFIKALIGEESLLLILPKDVSKELGIENQDRLQYEVKNQELVIKRIEIS